MPTSIDLLLYDFAFLPYKFRSSQYQEMHVPAEDGITQADSYFLLEDAATTYKLEEFPHLAGCKVLTVPSLPLQEVGQHIRPFMLAPTPSITGGVRLLLAHASLMCIRSSKLATTAVRHNAYVAEAGIECEQNLSM